MIVAASADLATKLNTSAAVGTFVADVMMVPDVAMAPIINKAPNYFADLSSVASKYRKDFPAVSWSNRNPNGKTVAMPFDNTGLVMYYRADLYRQAGIDPTKIDTWSQFLKAGQTLQAALPGVKMLGEDYTGAFNGLFPLLSQQRNTGYFNLKGDITINAPGAVQALTTIKSFKDAGLIQNLTGLDGLVAGLRANKVATVFFPAWFAGVLKLVAPDQKGKWGVMVPPGYSAKGTRVGGTQGNGYAIARNTKNFDAAWAYVEFVTTQAPVAIARAGGTPITPSYLPSLKVLAGMDDPYFATPKYLAPILQVNKSVPAARLSLDYYNAMNASNSAYSAVMNTGASPKDALDKAARDLSNQTGRKIASP